MNRSRILFACLALAIGITAWNWFFAVPSITLNVKNAPLSKVLKEFERQGNIHLVSNLDPSQPVTLFFEKTPVFDALETLATRADGSWRLAYLAAPQASQIDALLKAFVFKATDQPSWNSYQLRGGGGNGGMGASFEDAADPRAFVWEISPSESKDLTSYFAQAAQKTPAFFAIAPDWNPLVSKPPGSGPLTQSVPQLVSKAGGHVREVFLLEGRPNWRPDGETREAPSADAAPVEPTSRGPRPNLFANSLSREQTNPEWMAQRVEAAIQKLPAEEQAQVREDMKDMRTAMETIRQLPAEERRAKMEELMNNPKMADRMEQRAGARESRLSPSQRAERSKRYVDNKLKARAEAGRPMNPVD